MITYDANDSTNTIRVGVRLTTDGITNTYDNFRGYLKAEVTGNGTFESPTSDGRITRTEVVLVGDSPTPSNP